MILPFPSFDTPYNLALAMCSKYPITGSTTTLKYFECVVQFAIPFTTVVPSGGIMTSIIVQILPYFPSKSYSGESGIQ